METYLRPKGYYTGLFLIICCTDTCAKDCKTASLKLSLDLASEC